MVLYCSGLVVGHVLVSSQKMHLTLFLKGLGAENVKKSQLFSVRIFSWLESN